MRQNRVIHKSGSLTDLSVKLSDPFVGTALSLTVLSTDYIYFGSELPFNHRYFDIVTPNALASVVEVQYFDGTSWQDAIDVIDETALAGCSLGQSGRISWTTNPRVSSWSYYDTEIMSGTDLVSLKINGLYWARMSFSADLTDPVEINFVGQKFSEDEHLVVEYPELDRTDVKTAYKTGKTNWKDQSLVAAQYIAKDLIELGVLKVKEQIMDWYVFKEASVHKTAAIIFRAFGDDYKDQLAASEKSYRECLKARIYRIDDDADADVDTYDLQRNMEFMTR